MDEQFEAGILRIIDDALSSPATLATYKVFERDFTTFESEGTDKATEHTKKHFLGQFHYDIDKYMAAIDELLPPERFAAVDDLSEFIAWTVGDQFALTEEDLKDGYRSVDQFWEYLRDWRADYRKRFDR